jgi:hypothetical protein
MQLSNSQAARRFETVIASASEAIDEATRKNGLFRFRFSR